MHPDPETPAAAAPPSPNAPQRAFWASRGHVWVELEASYDAQLAPYSTRVLDALDPRPGERVLDVGCGTGPCTVALAERVGPTGRVVGLDLSPAMVDRARQRSADHPNVALVEGDAQHLPLADGAFDAAYSRFGVMFFADPQEAFTRVAGALRPGGRFAFACWQAQERNDWALVPARAAAAAGLDVPATDPDAPGPFALHDVVRLEAMLRGAGFAEVHVEPVALELLAGGGLALDDAVDFLLASGQLRALLDEADEATRTRVEDAVRAELTPAVTAAGVALRTAIWLVAARRPG